MSWAVRRQLQYLLGTLLFLGVLSFAILYPIVHKAPTCSDAKQNGKETGVDCGGICKRLCSAELAEPQILWKRAFLVSNTTYNLVAMVQNSNPSAGVEKANYEFRAYDTNNLLIGRRAGTTFIPPNQEFAIFEPRFEGGPTEIKSVILVFTSPLEWVKKPSTIQALPIRVENIAYGENDQSPSLSARITNDSIYNIPAFDSVAIVYDENRVAINASKTHIENLDTNTIKDITFTWPLPFVTQPLSQDVLLLINPFTTGF